MIRIILFFILVCSGPQFLDYNYNNNETKESVVVLSSESFLRIKGKTNVSSFECQFDMSSISEVIKINYRTLDNKIKFEDTKLVLPNVEFNCGGKAINKDFNKLLNTAEHPKITLKLKEISNLESQSQTLTATIEITISNVTRQYKMPINLAQDQDLHVNGVLPLNINDFNLEAPTKMLGMVKVSPQIEIQFSLKMLES